MGTRWAAAGDAEHIRNTNLLKPCFVYTIDVAQKTISPNWIWKLTLLPKLIVQFSGKKVNNRRKASHTSAGSEINFNGNVCCDPSEIVHGWGQYFSSLYSDTYREHYDAEFQSHVKERVRTITSELPASCPERRHCMHIGGRSCKRT